MKKNLLVITFLLVTVFAFGQKLPFQGKLILNGALVTTPQTFLFEINSIGWSETHTDVPVTDGLYFVVLGNINPLPDSLFSGVTEQNMNITVNGTALSPVVLFKPLSSPFEGTELNVRNLEGTVVGTLKARTDSVKHGEFNLLGENSGKIKAGFFKANEEPDTDMPFLSLQKDSTVLSYLSTTKWNNAFNGRLYLGSTNGDNANVYPNLYTGRHNGRTLFQVGHASWNNSENFGLLTLNGPNSGNFEITGQHWDNPDLPFFKMRGSNNQDVLILSAESDSLESGNLRIYSQSGNSVYMNAEHANFMTSDNNNTYIDHNGINIHTNNDKEMDLGSTRFSLRHTAENEWRETVILSTQNADSAGWAGHIDVMGPSSTNLHLGNRHWENANLPVIQFNGSDDFQSMELSAENNADESGFVNIRSKNGRSTGLNAQIMAMHDANDTYQTVALETKNNGQGDFGELLLNGPSGNPALKFTDSGGTGLLTVYGKTGGGIKSGFKWWEGEGGENRPFQALEGTVNPNFGLIYSHILGDNTVEHGQIELYSTNGSRADINAYRLTFDDTEQVRTYDVNGISGSGQLLINNGVNITGDLVANGSVLSSSDIRLKKNISPIKGSLEKIELLKGVSYNWRQDEFPEKNFSSDKQIGVIAQDLEAQFPALVKTDKDGYKSVNYSGFTAVLLEAVKELNAKVENLETENIQLKAELSVSAKNTSEIADLNEQMEALIKMVQLQQTEESIDEITSTPGLK